MMPPSGETCIPCKGERKIHEQSVSQYFISAFENRITIESGLTGVGSGQMSPKHLFRQMCLNPDVYRLCVWYIESEI